MDSDPDKRRKRLKYRAWHRGMKELDLLIGSFADLHLATMSDGELDEFEALLQVPEPILYDWLTGKGAPAPEQDNPTTRRLLAFRLELPQS